MQLELSKNSKASDSAGGCGKKGNILRTAFLSQEVVAVITVCTNVHQRHQSGQQSHNGGVNLSGAACEHAGAESQRIICYSSLLHCCTTVLTLTLFNSVAQQ